MQWVAQCDFNTQIAINDTQFDNRLICRDFEYYVNPESDSIVELGTIVVAISNLFGPSKDFWK